MFVDGHIRMGIANQLRGIDEGFAKIAAVPELKDKPIVIGESDPEGCAACQGSQFSYRNGTMYSSYTAASFARKWQLADKHGVNLAGALTWAFTFEDQPYFAGFRQLASNGIPLAVLNVFRMFSQMDGQRVGIESSGAVALDEILKNGVRQQADVSALASLDAHKLAVLLWHYHDDDLPGADAQVSIALAGLPVKASAISVKQFRIDDQHSNAYGTWKRQGSPVAPNEAQYAEMASASELAAIAAPSLKSNTSGQTTLELTLPRQAVSLLILEWK